ncbi:hypothetical protein [Dickeya oryzae]|uniref:Uncharacterized protein n=1 Tax=Dickeya oryzae TaxID=1240404 RepID=A0AB39IKX9_9GAMM|nr:hypothetical protein [Dickeya oryzae]MCA6993491.1 hypothetical protein [Dickeya oryzae]
MKKIIFLLTFLFIGVAQANCNENLKGLRPKQKAQNYIVNQKTFFYLNPLKKEYKKGLFLIPGDEFSGYLVFQDLTFGRYIRKNGEVVMGWLKSDTLKDATTSQENNLSEHDFNIYSPIGSIPLGQPYEKISSQWDKCLNSPAEIGGVVSYNNMYYKYSDYYADGLMIILSNFDYDKKGLDFDTYRITQVTISNSNYLTSRGMSVGMTKEEVINRYGEPSEKNKNAIVYNYKNYALQFKLKFGKVTEIVMDENFL